MLRHQRDKDEAKAEEAKAEKEGNKAEVIPVPFGDDEHLEREDLEGGGFKLKALSWEEFYVYATALSAVFVGKEGQAEQLGLEETKRQTSEREQADLDLSSFVSDDEEIQRDADRKLIELTGKPPLPKN